MPETVGSVTNTTKLAPESDDTTGHPIPGEPSTNTKSLSVSFAMRLASFLTFATSLPEFSAPIPRRAWTQVLPTFVLDIYHLPTFCSSITIASSVQTLAQYPQPSQSKESTLYLPSITGITSKRQTSAHKPH